MKKTKILHITQSTIGGTLEYIKLFFKNIDKEKFDVELICPEYGPMKGEIEELGFNVEVANMKRQISPIDDLKCFIKINSYIKITKPDIIHVHSSKAGVIGRLAAYKNHIPCIYNAHGWSFSMDVSIIKKKLYIFIEKMCSRLCDKIVNISSNEQQLAMKYKIAPINKMEIINNGIDIKDYLNKQIKNSLCICNNSYTIGMVGRLTEAKNPRLFVEIAYEISKAIDNCFFILVGDGELREEIELQIKHLGIHEKFLITGWTENVSMYLSIFDVALLTSKWEGFGLVLTEYMISKVPIVASNVGGIPNVVIHNRNGILVDPGDKYTFVNAILKIKEDKLLREYFIENSYSDVKLKFNIDRVVKEHEKLYFSILNKMDK